MKSNIYVTDLEDVNTDEGITIIKTKKRFFDKDGYVLLYNNESEVFKDGESDIGTINQILYWKNITKIDNFIINHKDSLKILESLNCKRFRPDTIKIYTSSQLNTDKALSFLKNIKYNVYLDRDSVTATRYIVDKEPNAFLSTIRSLYVEKKWAKLCTVCKEYLLTSSTNLDSEKSVEIRFYMGYGLMQMKYYDDAKQIFEEAIKLNPKSEFSQYIYGNLDHIKFIDLNNAVNGIKWKTISNKVLLFIEMYDCDTNRKEEFYTVLKHNLDNSSIGLIFIFYSDDKVYTDIRAHFKTDKIRLVKKDSRLTFKTCFEYINHNIPHSINVVVANSDIIFDATLSKVNNLEMNNVAICLLRYDINKDGTVELFKKQNADVEGRDDSQDCWIVQTPVKNVDCDFYFGVRRSDNKLMYELSNAGYSIVNCPYDIHSYHLHTSNIRTYNQSALLPTPYMYTNLTKINLDGKVDTSKSNCMIKN